MVLLTFSNSYRIAGNFRQVKISFFHSAIDWNENFTHDNFIIHGHVFYFNGKNEN